MPRPIVLDLRKQGKLELPFFDGFPYLVTKVVPTMYHIILLPAGLAEEELVDLGLRQVTANRLQTCLVFSHDDCVFFEVSGGIFRVSEPPKSTVVICDKLRSPRNFPPTLELEERKERLKSFVDSLRREGVMFGDLTKGGRDATPEELRQLEGVQDGGIPWGLTRCVQCGDWVGQCLDPNPKFAGKIMRVHCRCDNDNLCAFCGRTLHDRKLNANFLGEDGDIWHVPGFSAFRHECLAREAVLV